MATTLTKKEDGTILLTITLPVAAVKKAREQVIQEHAKETTLAGFRKGMAPKDLVEKSLDQAHVQEDTLRKLLPEAYAEAVKEQKLQPVMSPRIRVTKLDEGKDWEFTAETCEAPTIDLGNYQDAVKKVTAKSKIALPGKEEQKPNVDDVMKVLLETAKTTVPTILVETESERLLSQLLDEVKSLGLSLDQYLASTHKTIEQIKTDYMEKAKQDITAEFVLQAVANQEKISVEQKELEEALEKAQSPEERKNLEANIYLLASILRQQKTIDFLLKL